MDPQPYTCNACFYFIYSTSQLVQYLSLIIIIIKTSQNLFLVIHHTINTKMHTHDHVGVACSNHNNSNNVSISSHHNEHRVWSGIPNYLRYSSTIFIAKHVNHHLPAVIIIPTFSTGDPIFNKKKLLLLLFHIALIWQDMPLHLIFMSIFHPHTKIPNKMSFKTNMRASIILGKQSLDALKYVCRQLL